jgi:uncharacterized transporter YbjL
MRPEGALWIGIGFLITFIPVVIMALVALRLCKMDFGNTCGMLCGSMAKIAFDDDYKMFPKNTKESNT